MATRTLTDQQRAERRARERELVQHAVEQLRCSEGWQAWLRARSRFHRYSLHNQLLIALQRPTAQRVAGFKAWLALGYCVRRGETAIRIWAPCPPSRKQTERWQQSGADPDQRPRTFFRLAAVFAQDQVDPLPPPATPAPLQPPIAAITGDTLAHLLTPLTELSRSIGYRVEHHALNGPEGSCNPKTQQIAIENSLSANGQVAALIHELAHALVHVDRHDDDPTLSYAQEELVVESVAWSVCGVVGLDTSPNSIPYLAAWSQNTDLAILEQTAQLIDRLANRIEDALPQTPTAPEDSTQTAGSAHRQPSVPAVGVPLAGSQSLRAA
jgi:antirestriction protein ArdC